METFQANDFSGYAFDIEAPINININTNGASINNCENEEQNQDSEGILQLQMQEAIDVAVRNTKGSAKNIIIENLSNNCLGKKNMRSEIKDIDDRERLRDDQIIIIQNQPDEFNSESLLVPKKVGSSVDVQCHQLEEDIREDVLQEITSCEPEKQICQDGIVENNVEDNSASKKLADILCHIKKLSSSEFILLDLQLPKRDIEKNKQLSKDTLRSTMENGELDISEKNKKLMKIITRSLSYDSITKVAAIIEGIKDIILPEYLWLRCNLPADCANPNLQHCLVPCSSDNSQFILWLKTHYEENTQHIVLKHEIQNKYGEYCAKLKITPMSTTKFGRVLRQVFPGVSYTRKKLNGENITCYTGLQYRSHLKRPRLAVLSKKPQDLGRYNLFIDKDSSKEVTMIMDCPDYNNSFTCHSNLDNDTNVLPKSPITALPHLVEGNPCSNSLKINVSQEIFNLNTNPLVYIDKDEVDQWYKRHIINYIERLSKIVVTQPNHIENCGLSFVCCRDDFEISHTYAQQLNYLKVKLSQLVVRSLNNYKFEILKVTNSDKVDHKRRSIQETSINKHIHPTIKKLRKTFNHVSFPNEILYKDVDPVVVLDSGEVTNWYIIQINQLKDQVKMCKYSKEPNSKNSDIRRAQIEYFVKENDLIDNNCESDKDNHTFNKVMCPSTTLRADNGPRCENEENSHKSLKRPLQINTSDALVSEYTLQSEQKRLKVDEGNYDFEQRQKKNYNKITPNTKMVLQPILLDGNEENTNNVNIVTDKETVICLMCDLEFDSKHEFLNHQKSHLTCNTCRRKLSNMNSMREHLINHCYLNGTNKPLLVLKRIDSVPEIANKYKKVFTTSPNKKVENPRTYPVGNKRIESLKNAFNTDDNLADIKPNFILNSLNDSAQFQQSINANLNKILLLSNNHQQSESQSVIYGTLYLNSSNAQSSGPSTPLNSTCITSERTSATFMQIVETLSTSPVAVSNSTSLSVAQQLQDHSYHQQIQVKVENQSLCDSNSVPDISLKCSETIISDDNSANENTSKNDNLSDNQESTSIRQSEFRIRVKSIQELR